MIIILSILLTVVGYINFTQQKDIIIRQQQEHLLTIAKSISRNINDFIENNISNLGLLSEDNSIVGYDMKLLKSYYDKYSNELNSVSVWSKTGELICTYPQTPNRIDEFALNKVLTTRNFYIGKEYSSDSNQFSIDVFQPIFSGNEVVGILSNSISLNKIYINRIESIKAGKKGYAMVKNVEGIILMHPVSEQIGIESLKVRKEMYPEHNWSELEALHKMQVDYGEGYTVYHSKWWQEEGQNWTKKINAFTTYKIGDVKWIISVQMDYAEIAAPIHNALVNISLIAIIILILFTTMIYTALKVNKERKELEIETKYLKELNKAWEELIKSEAQLRHSHKLQTIGVLASSVAHEFNNQLSPIIGYSEILLGEIDKNNYIYDDIAEIHKGALNAKNIIEQILSFSRNENTTANFEELDVISVIKSSIGMISSILPNHIKIQDNCSGNAYVFGNATQLQQIFLNLFTNAYQAIKGKDGIIEVNAIPSEKYINIQIIDTGSGMDKTTLDQIFDPFFTTKESNEGTGLGMSVVLSIVESHSGKIEINSTINTGTSVNIYLPLIFKS